MIPVQSTDITAAWLSEVLARPVDSVTARNLGAGVGILGEVARLTIAYPDGVEGPATLVAKCQSMAPENIGLATAMGFYDREINFYRHAAAHLPVRVPHCYHADMAEGSVPFVLLLEDIQGATCPNQIAGISLEEVTRILETVAGVHATFWDSEQLHSFDWLPPMNNPMYKGAQALAEAKWEGYMCQFGHRLTDATKQAITAVVTRYPAYLDWLAETTSPTLSHTDCRAENYLFGGSAGSDAITMIDFQMVTRFSGMYDVANLLSGSLLPDVRRPHESDLIERYHRALVAAGVTDYSIETCRKEYRACLLLQAFGSVCVSGLDGGNDRGAELLNELLVRPALNLNEHDVSDILEAF